MSQKTKIYEFKNALSEIDDACLLQYNEFRHQIKNILNNKITKIFLKTIILWLLSLIEKK